MRRTGLCAVALLLLTGCIPFRPEAGPDPSPAPTPRSTPVAEQSEVLAQLAAELRDTVDALSALVPAVTFRGRTGNRAVACFVGAEDDGTKQWNYAFRIFFDGDPEELGQAAERLLLDRGFRLRENIAGRQGPVSFTALRDGASILVSSGPDDVGSAVVFSGASACVAPDGTVDRTNPQ